jgi:hypothetical protein
MNMQKSNHTDFHFLSRTSGNELGSALFGFTLSQQTASPGSNAQASINSTKTFLMDYNDLVRKAVNLSKNFLINIFEKWR